MQSGDDFFSKAKARTIAWARQRLGPADFSDLITQVEDEPLRYGRLITRYASRTATWVEEPATGSKHATGQALDVDSLDLWAAEPGQLAQDSCHLTACRTCRGDGKVACPACQGTLRARCFACGGSGRVMSKAKKSFRMVNCRNCRGKGTRKCVACTAGKVPCSPCEGSGSMCRWLKVDTTQRTYIGIWPNDKRLSAHPGLRVDSLQALQWGSATLLESTDVQGRLQVSDIHTKVQAQGLQAAQGPLEPSLHPLRDRVLSQSLQVFAAPSATVHFEFAGKRGFLKMLGQECHPSADSNTAPFQRRGWCLLGTAAVACLGASLLRDAFLSRHPFYAAAPGNGYVSLAAVGLALGACLVVAAWLRRRQEGGRRAPQRWHDKLGLPLAGASLIIYLSLFLFIRPSATEIVNLLAAGHMDMAELHAEALQAQGQTSPEFVAARNTLLLARTQQLDNRKAVELLGRFSGSRAGTEPLEAERQRLRQEWAAAALERGDERAVEEELSVLGQEGAPQSLVDGLHSQLESRRIAMANELLAQGRVEESINALKRIKAPHLASEPPEPLLTQAYLEQARGCAERDLACRGTALKHAVSTSSSDEAKAALAAFRASELERLQLATRATGSIGSKLRILKEAEADARGFFASMEGDEDVSAAREALIAHREALVRGRRPFGEPIEVVVHLLGTGGVQEHKPGILKLANGPHGMAVFFFMENDVSRGLYITSIEHESKALSTIELQHLVKTLTGHEFAAKDLTWTKPGVTHRKARLGKHPALLGWHDGQLVEVSIGKVKP